MSEKSERAKRAVQSKRTSEQCEQTSERTSEWPSTQICILGYSGTQCFGKITISFPPLDSICYVLLTLKDAICSRPSARPCSARLSYLPSELFVRSPVPKSVHSFNKLSLNRSVIPSILQPNTCNVSMKYPILYM